MLGTMHARRESNDARHRARCRKKYGVWQVRGHRSGPARRKRRVRFCEHPAGLQQHVLVLHRAAHAGPRALAPHRIHPLRGASAGAATRPRNAVQRAAWQAAGPRSARRRSVRQRGTTRRASLQPVLLQVQALAQQGIREVVLLGQNVNS